MVETPAKKNKRNKRHKRIKATVGASATPNNAPDEYDSDAVDVVNEGSDHQLESPVARYDPSLPNSPHIDKFKSMTPPTMSSSSSAPVSNTVLSKSQKRKKTNQRNKDASGTSSEEERWLDAIESGKLEQVEQVELKKIKDPRLMTARQRAMYERGTDKETAPSPGVELLMALPSGYKEKVMTAEAIQKAAIKSQKRKQLADEKREKEKKRTMDRLLKKQDSRASKNTRSRPAKTVEPVVSFRSTRDGNTVTFPPEFDLPSLFAGPRKVAAKGHCGLDGSHNVKDCAMCGAAKRYNCSRTNIPLCSFKCYKLNVATLKQIMC